jgi:Xaa-Pro aminopeptidase/Xaa-Pro dipeptidase
VIDSEGINRVIRLQMTAVNLGLNGLLFLDMTNIRYLVGFTGSDGALIIGEDAAVLLVDGRYTTQAKQETLNIEIIEYQDKIDAISSTLLRGEWQKVGIESKVITLHDYLKLRDKLSDLELIPLADELCAIRSVKDWTEINRIKKAAGISSDALTSTLSRIRAGVAEKDIALELEFQIRNRGAENISFEIIVASGANSAMPHARPGDRRLEPGDFVVFDYGAVYEGYCSDETSTIVLGNISDRQREVYEIVKEAHDSAINSIKAGIPCNEIDRKARNIIEKKGLGQYFSHGTGHGVGLSVHENPRISTPSTSHLEAGMVITIEPGVYFPGLWGIRIEDMVLVKDNGCEILTTFSKELKVVSL